MFQLLLIITCSASCEVHGEHLIKTAEVSGFFSPCSCNFVLFLFSYIMLFCTCCIALRSYSGVVQLNVARPRCGLMQCRLVLLSKNKDDGGGGGGGDNDDDDDDDDDDDGDDDDDDDGDGNH